MPGFNCRWCCVTPPRKRKVKIHVVEFLKLNDQITMDFAHHSYSGNVAPIFHDVAPSPLQSHQGHPWQNDCRTGDAELISELGTPPGLTDQSGHDRRTDQLVGQAPKRCCNLFLWREATKITEVVGATRHLRTCPTTMFRPSL